MNKLSHSLLLIFFSLFVLAETTIPVQVNGADAVLAENIRLTVGSITEDDLQSYFFANRIKSAIKKSTNALGYYHSTFNYEIKDSILNLNLTPGPVVNWGSANINVQGTAAQLPAIQNLLANTPFTQGQPINHAVYDDYKQRLFDLCLFHGFQNARFVHSELHINLSENIATPTINIDAGSRYKISGIIYSGSQLSEPLLVSLEAIKVNDWYSRSVVAKQYKALLDTGYFKNVEVQTTFDHSNHLATLVVTLEDAPEDQVLIGAGFGTDTGPRLTLRWSKPLVNASGHSLASELEISEPLQELTTRYQIPMDHPLEHFIEWGTGVQNKSVEDTESLRINTGLNLHTSLGRWQQIIGVNLENEQYSQGDEPSQQTTYVLPTASWSYSAIADGGEKGFRFWLNMQTSTEDLYSETNFFRTVTGFKYLLPVGNNHSLITRLEVGILLNEDFDKVPSSKRFFTGGDQTVRGYEFESLAPRNNEGDLIGGDRLNVASLEYRWRFNPHWALATFIDTGRAYTHSSEPFRTGAGIGARWFSPIGQVSFNIAFPINDDEYDGFQIHISMGPSI
ncbi:autotransporter assembly complex family protein [Oceanicoccus sp. KOV_DT_Chl]|uniref:autotransporter assembly complex protein TamA n=1 Tax=Oceanicoccus sp. KOV_DT_Chl TaxID=1904639 RepID=UPI000C7B5BD3|nr:autotransporter assembly complex family protein [Oceanicoccus sp. KOV_DT_Chl]